MNLHKTFLAQSCANLELQVENKITLPEIIVQEGESKLRFLRKEYHQFTHLNQ